MAAQFNPTKPLQEVLKIACEGTAVSTRELLKTLSREDLASIKEGELTSDDLRAIVLDLAESKNDAENYSYSPQNRGSHDSWEE